MKKIIITFLFVIASSVALAQNNPLKSYSGISLSYQSNSQIYSGNSSEYCSGFGVNYQYGFNLIDEMPLYLETGAGLSMGYKQIDANPARDINKKSITFLDLQIPVNVTYSLNVKDIFSINPFVGINAKCYVLGLGMDGDESVNLLGENNYSIFNIGWQIGANIQYSKYWVGVSYGSDFTECIKNSKRHWSRFAVSLGLKF